MQAKNKQNQFKKILKIIRKYLTIIVFVVNLVALFLMYWATQALDYKGSENPIIAYLGLFFPLVFFGNLCFPILWLVTRKWKLALVPIIAIVFMWPTISIYYPLNLRTSDKDIPDDAIKVLSYNVRGFNWLLGTEARENPIFEYVKASKADIVCFQEFSMSGDKNKDGLITKEELDKVLKDYPYKNHIRLGNLNAHHFYGIACYSKFPIKKATRMPYAASSYNGSVIYQIEINGKLVTLANNHLESNRITSEDKELYYHFIEKTDMKTLDEVAHNIHDKLGTAYKIREAQTKILNEYLSKEKTDATIICGDFNDVPYSYTYGQMRGNLIDAFVETGRGQGISFNENMFWFKIDYILHSDNMEAYNCTVDRFKSSDHYPIWTYLRFKK